MISKPVTRLSVSSLNVWQYLCWTDWEGEAQQPIFPATAGQTASQLGVCAKEIRAKQSHPGPDPLWGPRPKASPARGCPNILGHRGAPCRPPGQTGAQQRGNFKNPELAWVQTPLCPTSVQMGSPLSDCFLICKGGLRTPEPPSGAVRIKLDTRGCLQAGDPCSLSGLPHLGRGGLGSKGKPGLHGAPTGGSNTAERG